MAVSPKEELSPPPPEDIASDGGESEPDEARVPAVIPAPEAPTPQEVAEHEIGHLPFRSWCSHCVRAKAQSAPHRAATAAQTEEHRLPTVSLDYFFMGSEGLGFQDEQAQDVLPLVAMYDHKTRTHFAHACLRKKEQRGTALTTSRVTWSG